jgi:hypothetical protein
MVKGAEIAGDGDTEFCFLIRFEVREWVRSGLCLWSFGLEG